MKIQNLMMKVLDVRKKRETKKKNLKKKLKKKIKKKINTKTYFSLLLD